MANKGYFKAAASFAVYNLSTLCHYVYNIYVLLRWRSQADELKSIRSVCVKERNKRLFFQCH